MIAGFESLCGATIQGSGNDMTQMKTSTLAAMMNLTNSQNTPSPLSSSENEKQCIPDNHTETLSAQSEQVVMLPIKGLLNFPKSRYNRYQEYTGSKMEELIESIRTQGILQPLIVRPKGNGYQIISGHNRRTAALAVGWDKAPCLIRNLTDDEAICQLNEINMQQRDLLPSQKAFAYKIKLDGLKQQGLRRDLTSCQDGTKLRSDELMAQFTEDSARQIQRYIRLTRLTDDLLDAVDAGLIGLVAGGSLSDLRPETQDTFYAACFKQTENGVCKNNGICFNEKIIHKLLEKDAAHALSIEEVESIVSSANHTAKTSSPKLNLKSVYTKYPQLSQKSKKEVEELISTALSFYFESQEKS